MCCGAFSGQDRGSAGHELGERNYRLSSCICSCVRAKASAAERVNILNKYPDYPSPSGLAQHADGS